MTHPQRITAPFPSERHRSDTELAELRDRLDDLDVRVANGRLIRDTWTLIIFAIAALALVASVIAIGLAMRAVDEAERHTTQLLALDLASTGRIRSIVRAAGSTVRSSVGGRPT